MNILGPATATLHRVAYNLRGAISVAPHPRLVDDMLPALWDAALAHGIDPIVMVAQSTKETAAGQYTGKVPATFYNTCGLKIRTPSLAGVDQDAPIAHAQFASWWAGATAHAQHLLAYTQRDLPVGEQLLDPRWVWVRKPDVTPVVTVEGLSGRWAPSSSYGTEIATIAARLQDRQ